VSFHEALLDADTLEDLPGKWQAAILRLRRTDPKLRVAATELVRIPGNCYEVACAASQVAST
jgi:hypothetical protein